jgi:hypothetical protein
MNKNKVVACQKPEQAKNLLTELPRPGQRGTGVSLLSSHTLDPPCYPP